jgi:type IV fimbrial biogenesis protein FimT
MLTLGYRVPRLRGFTLVELMIVIAVLGILMMIGLPNMTLMFKNGQVRTAAESAAAGLQTARNEAIRRNATVRFQLTSDLTSSCALSSSGTSWVVSLATPAGACNATPVDPSDTAPANPAIIQTRSGAEGTTKATVSGTDSAAAAATTVTFNGVGRVSGSGIATIDFAHVTDACQHAATPGPIRCLRILVSTGGTIKMCDPNVAATDSRFCGL